MRTIARLIRSMLLSASVAGAGLVVALWVTSYRSPLALRLTEYWPGDDRFYRAAESNAGWVMLWSWTSVVPERQAYMGPPPATRSTRLVAYFAANAPRGRPDEARQRFGLHSSDTEARRLFGYTWRAASAPHAVALVPFALFPLLLLAVRTRRRGVLAAVGSFTGDLFSGLAAIMLLGLLTGLIAGWREPVGLNYETRATFLDSALRSILRITEAHGGFSGGNAAIGWHTDERLAWRWDVREASVGPGFRMRDIGLDFDRGTSVAGVRFVHGRSSAGSTWFGVAVPWFVAVPALLLAVAPVAIVPEIRARREARRRRAGLCPKCGYDLRASAGACPECGTPIADSAAGAILPGHASDQHRRIDPSQGQGSR